MLKQWLYFLSSMIKRQIYKQISKPMRYIIFDWSKVWIRESPNDFGHSPGGQCRHQVSSGCWHFIYLNDFQSYFMSLRMRWNLSWRPHVMIKYKILKKHVPQNLYFRQAGRTYRWTAFNNPLLLRLSSPTHQTNPFHLWPVKEKRIKSLQHLTIEVYCTCLDWPMSESGALFL